MVLTLARLTSYPPSARRPDPQDELEEFCRQIQLISRRDLDGTVSVVFRAMLMEGRQAPVGSSTLAQRTRLNRITVLHHLRRLESMGLVEHTAHKYRLRVRGLSDLVEQMRQESMAMFEEARIMANRLDQIFGVDPSPSSCPPSSSSKIPSIPPISPFPIHRSLPARFRRLTRRKR